MTVRCIYAYNIRTTSNRCNASIQSNVCNIYTIYIGETKHAINIAVEDEEADVNQMDYNVNKQDRTNVSILLLILPLIFLLFSFYYLCHRFSQRISSIPAALLLQPKA